MQRSSLLWSRFLYTNSRLNNCSGVLEEGSISTCLKPILVTGSQSCISDIIDSYRKHETWLPFYLTITRTGVSMHKLNAQGRVKSERRSIELAHKREKSFLSVIRITEFWWENHHKLPFNSKLIRFISDVW